MASLQHLVLAGFLVLMLVEFEHQRTRPAESENLVENAVGKLALGHLWQFDGCVRREKGGGVQVGVKAHAFAGYIVDHNCVGALAQQLGAAVFHAVFSLRGKADNELPGTAPANDLSQNIFSRREFQRDGARCA